MLITPHTHTHVCNALWLFTWIVIQRCLISVTLLSKEQTGACSCILPGKLAVSWMFKLYNKVAEIRFPHVKAPAWRKEGAGQFKKQGSRILHVALILPFTMLCLGSVGKGVLPPALPLIIFKIIFEKAHGLLLFARKVAMWPRLRVCASTGH